MTSVARPVVKTVGRPRSAEADRAIVDAAMELFAEHGFDGLTMEGVAQRAGVGKATLYRRYPCKVDLVMAAARTVTAEQAPDPDTGSVDADLRKLAAGLVRVLTTTAAGPAITQLVAELPRNPQLADAHRAFTDARRAIIATAVRRGVERGELRPDSDAALVGDSLAGPIFYRYLVMRERLDTRYANRLVDQLMAAYGA